MPRYLWLRIGIVVAVIVGSALLLAPRDWRGQPRQPINLGLDLQGGIHLVLGVDLEKGDRERARPHGGQTCASALQQKGIGAQVTRQGAGAGSWSSSARRRRSRRPSRRWPSFVEFDVPGAGRAAGRIELALNGEGARRAPRPPSCEQGLEVIRNRVDQFGVAEPTIQKQGDNRILVQLPGVQDPARAKALIGKTAVLEFKLVDDQVDVARAVQEGPPAGDEVLYGRRVDRDDEDRDAGPLRGPEGDAADRGPSSPTRKVSRLRRRASPTCPSTFDSVGARVFGEVDREERRQGGSPSSSTATSTPRR